MKNYFGHSSLSPFHLSVGAVLVNDQGQVACHYFDKITDDKTAITYKNFYILMRETVEPNEPLEQSVTRGLKEEFGATGEILDYLGPQFISMQREGYSFFKTTLYFLVRLISIDVNSRLDDDPERGSQIQRHDVEFLIQTMQHQIGKDYREDMNESEILERARPLLQQPRT